jgi:hypothetical protein
MTPALQTDADFEQVSVMPGLRGAVATAAAAGRFEGSVKRESDGATYLRAIELGTATDITQPIKCYEQVGGALPSTPQYTGKATALGPFVIFGTTDSVADRKYISLVFGNFMISTSTSIYHDGRPDVKLGGLLRRV